MFGLRGLSLKERKTLSAGGSCRKGNNSALQGSLQVHCMRSTDLTAWLMQSLKPRDYVFVKSKQSERVQAKNQTPSPGPKILFVNASKLHISRLASMSQSMAKMIPQRRFCFVSRLASACLPWLPAGSGNCVQVAFSNPWPIT